MTKRDQGPPNWVLAMLICFVIYNFATIAYLMVLAAKGGDSE